MFDVTWQCDRKWFIAGILIHRLVMKYSLYVLLFLFFFNFPENLLHTGRARMEKSSYHIITSADQQHLEDREKMNLYQEGKCS